ncbi:MAG: BON domain-containing protein [Anaerolineae bacterium]|nr:BON domain-containing protein [Gemmatimonadaceae bacterium]
MEENEETNPKHYPLGRGYGNDYMRGGEVFGGYGYRDREEYLRTLGGDLPDAADERWLEELVSAPRELDGDGNRPRGIELFGDKQASVHPADSDAPVPEIEHTYGSPSGAGRHSRSYYVTQAQLQQRFYGPTLRTQGPYQERLRTLERADADLIKDIQDALFYDTWVDASRITVDVTDAIVTLRGHLPSNDEIRFAGEDAWSVAGVREVRSELKLARARPEVD